MHGRPLPRTARPSPCGQPPPMHSSKAPHPSSLFISIYRSITKSTRIIAYHGLFLITDYNIWFLGMKHMRMSCKCMWHCIARAHVHILRRGEDTVDWDTVGSNCSTENCVSIDFNKRRNSKNSNWELWARWGFPTVLSPLPNGMPTSPKKTCRIEKK